MSPPMSELRQARRPAIVPSHEYNGFSFGCRLGLASVKSQSRGLAARDLAGPCPSKTNGRLLPATSSATNLLADDLLI